MADKQMNIGVKYTGDVKDFKRASDEARRATAQLRREAIEHSREMERKFKDLAMVFAKIGGAVVVAQQAFRLFATAMNSTEGSADKLEATMAYLKGGVQGFLEAIVTDNLEGMTTLMKEAASASRNLAIELDRLADVQAGGKLKQSFLNERLQTLRVQIAGTTNAADKGALIQEAINISKEIAASEIDIKQDEISAYVKYYADRLHIDQAYYKDFQKIVTMIAKDWRYYDSEEFKTTMNSRINVLKNYTSELSKSERAELRQYEAIKAFIDAIYMPAKDELSGPGKWNEFIGLLTQITDLSAAGEESIRRLTGQLTTAGKAMGGPRTSVSGILGGGMATAPSLSQIEGMNKLATATSQAAEALVNYDAIASSITGSFENLFSAGIQGWDEFGKAAVNAIQQMLIKLAALAATYAVLSMIPGFSGFMEAVGGFGGFIRQGMGFSTNPVRMSDYMGKQGSAQFKISGRDLVYAYERSGSSLMGNT